MYELFKFSNFSAFLKELRIACSWKNHKVHCQLGVSSLARLLVKTVYGPYLMGDITERDEELIGH